jgi:hypothetical protein
MSRVYQGGIAACLLFSGASALCQDVVPNPSMESPKVASQNVPLVAVNEHPLMPVIRWAEKERPNIAAVKDYTAILQKQENIGGEVQEAQVMEIKVRHQPFSAYLKFRYPQKMNGQEAIYIRGQNDGKLIGHGVGLEKRLGTQFLDPEGFIAMRGCKYPMTQIGILNLVDKLLEVGYKDSKFGECEVTYKEGVKVGGKDSARDCTMIQVMHPVPRQNFIFYVARIYVDKELNLPIRYESYDWARKDGESPTVIEAYTYLNVKVNVGLTDADFDYKNSAYGYSK